MSKIQEEKESSGVKTSFLDLLLNNAFKNATLSQNKQVEMGSCHCGVLDLAVLRDGNVVFGGDLERVKQFVMTKFPAAITHYVSGSVVQQKNGTGTLHVNFGSEAELVAAMEKSCDGNVGNRLVRCWGKGGEPCCGLPVSRFPELVLVSLAGNFGMENAKSAGEIISEMSGSLKKLVGENVLIDRIWVNHRIRNVVVHVRFHLMRDVRILVEKEKEMKVFGMGVMVDVPNVPELVRCFGCGGRGHMREKCPQISSKVVIRFSFVKPVHEIFRRQIAEIGGSQNVFVGLSKNGSAPNPMVHCVYGNEKEAEVGAVKIVETYGSILVCAPVQVNMRDEGKSCNWCGSLEHRRSNCLRFQSVLSANGNGFREVKVGAVAGMGNGNNVGGWSGVVKRVGNRDAGNGADPNIIGSQTIVRMENVNGNRGVGLGSNVRGVNRIGGDRGCYEWRSLGVCRNGEGCKFDHRMEEKGVGRVCWEWKSKGECRFGESCRYSHVGGGFGLVQVMKRGENVGVAKVVEEKKEFENVEEKNVPVQEMSGVDGEMKMSEMVSGDEKENGNGKENVVGNVSDNAGIFGLLEESVGEFQEVNRKSQREKRKKRRQISGEKNVQNRVILSVKNKKARSETVNEMVQVEQQNESESPSVVPVSSLSKLSSPMQNVSENVNPNENGNVTVMMSGSGVSGSREDEKME